MPTELEGYVKKNSGFQPMSYTSNRLGGKFLGCCGDQRIHPGRLQETIWESMVGSVGS
jgi:hypothetical protein